MKNKAYLVLLSIVLLLYAGGCKDSPTTNIYNITVADSLSNPDIDPKVVFTNPADGSSGPYGDTDPTHSHDYPQITIQFNKLININNYGINSITLRTDDADYYLSLQYGYRDVFTNILVFYLNERYQATKTYTLRIDTTFIDVHGKKLNKPFIANFVPEPKFRVFHVHPTVGEIEPLYLSQFYINFNSKVDSTIFNSLSVSPAIDGFWSLHSNNYPLDSSSVYFILSDTLSYNTEYTVAVGSDAKDREGSLIDKSYQYSFKTAPFRVGINSYSSYVGPGGFYVSNNFYFEFNALIDTSSVRNSILVSPQISYDISFPYGPGFHYVRINFNDLEFQNNTEYTIHFSPAIKSIYGDALEEYSFSFSTGQLN